MRAMWLAYVGESLCRGQEMFVTKQNVTDKLSPKNVDEILTYLTFNRFHNDLELINDLHVIRIVLNDQIQKVFDFRNFF